jgi:hypothetical protein
MWLYSNAAVRQPFINYSFWAISKRTEHTPISEVRVAHLNRSIQKNMDLTLFSFVAVRDDSLQIYTYKGIHI